MLAVVVDELFVVLFLGVDMVTLQLLVHLPNYV